MFLKSSVGQHFVGVIGQVSSALPLLLITIFLSRVVGLKEAGQFTILVGLSAAVFSFSLLGLRTVIVRDGLQIRSAWHYVFIRVLAIFIACVITYYIGHDFGIDKVLLGTIVLYRICDALIDFNLAVEQVWFKGALPLFAYSKRHFLKLIILLVAVGINYYSPYSFSFNAFFISGLLTLVLISVPLLRSLRVNAGSYSVPSFNNFVYILKQSWWFTIAITSCAAITSFPRVSIAWLYEGEIMGVIGVTLSITTFFGMMYNTSWMRFFPRLSICDDPRKLAISFVKESIIIAVFLMLCGWFILPLVVGFVFKFNVPEYLVISKFVLVTSAVFFLGQVVSNLFKLTIYPWLEIIVYMVGFIVPVIVYTLSSTNIGMPALLIISGGSMFVMSIIVFFGAKPAFHSGVSG